MTSPFLPKEYEVSGGTGANYMKFIVGENKLRILASPIIGWEWWVDKEGNPRIKDAKPQKGDKPVRVAKDSGNDIPADAGDTIREFWALPVYNYQEKKVQVLELTQKRIMRTVHSLAKDKEWGSPLGYDLLILRTGEGLDTDYDTLPQPPKELAKEVQEAWEKVEAKGFDLNRLFENGDPFGGQVSGSTAGDDPSGLVS